LVPEEFADAVQALGQVAAVGAEGKAQFLGDEVLLLRVGFEVRGGYGGEELFAVAVLAEAGEGLVDHGAYVLGGDYVVIVR
jgi:hypothetical protein